MKNRVQSVILLSAKNDAILMAENEDKFQWSQMHYNNAKAKYDNTTGKDSVEFTIQGVN